MEGDGRELGGDFLEEGEEGEGEEGAEEVSVSSGIPNLIIFLIIARQNHEQQQEAKRQGKAIRSQIKSKSKEKGEEFSCSRDFLSWIF